MSVATKAQETKDAVELVFQKKCAEIETRATQLKRIKTPASDVSEDATQQAIEETQAYLESLGVVF